MPELKIYLPEKLEKKFRKLSMTAYGFRRGSLSRAAEEALQQWCSDMEDAGSTVEEIDDPLDAIKGMLKGVQKTGVELQHEARRYRAAKTLPRR